MIVKYEPVDKVRGNFLIAMNLDMKLDIVPIWLMEKIVIQFGNEYFLNVIEISKKFKGSKWEKSVEKNPHLFNFFNKALKDHLKLK